MLIHPNTGTISLTDSYLSGFFYLAYDQEEANRNCKRPAA